MIPERSENVRSSVWRNVSDGILPIPVFPSVRAFLPSNPNLSIKLTSLTFQAFANLSSHQWNPRSRHACMWRAEISKHPTSVESLIGCVVQAGWLTRPHEIILHPRTSAVACAQDLLNAGTETSITELANFFEPLSNPHPTGHLQGVNMT